MGTARDIVKAQIRAGRVLALASLVCLLAGASSGQQATKPLPAFDAASVRPFADRCGAWGKPDIDPTHLRMRCAPLRFIILNAYSLDDYQLTSLPDWASSEFFTISAVTDAPTPPDQMLLRLRQLLTERFHLQLQESEKEQPVWAIVVPHGGHKMKPRADTEECPRYISDDDMKAAGAPRNSMSSFNGCTMADLVKGFNRRDHLRDLGRPVIDKTGLTGRYHMLIWQEMDVDESSTEQNPKFSNIEPFREAVEQELGLKLVEDKQTLSSFKVLNVARPDPN